MCLLHTCIFFRRTPRSREMVAEQSMFATFVCRYWFCRRRHRTILGRDGSMDPSHKTLGAEMWDALSAEAKSKHPRVLARHAMLKMCFVEKDQMNLSVNDVKRMLNTPAVQEALSRAEEYMTSMRKVREKSTRTRSWRSFWTASVANVRRWTRSILISSPRSIWRIYIEALRRTLVLGVPMGHQGAKGFFMIFQ